MKPLPMPQPGFGVDPGRGSLYSLRMARYDALAQEIDDWAGTAAGAGKRLEVLIVGCGAGSELRHLRTKRHFADLDLSGANADDGYLKHFDRRDYREVFIGDLMAGYPQIPSGAFDVVICEQVLEHLERLPAAIGALARVVKPGGKVIVGVPIFPPPLHLIRRHVVPRLDALLSRHRARGHVQAFSLHSFLATLRRYSDLRPVAARGFRVVSGGPLRPLENRVWWWRFNRRLGELVPALCVEVQVILERPAAGRGEDGAAVIAAE